MFNTCRGGTAMIEANVPETVRLLDLRKARMFDFLCATLYSGVHIAVHTFFVHTLYRRAQDECLSLDAALLSTKAFIGSALSASISLLYNRRYAALFALLSLF